jgi:hypothetical protein
MPVPRAGCIAGVVDGRLLVAGRSYREADRKILSARADLFDAQTNRWISAPALPAPRSDTAFATTDAVYVFGGVVEGAPTASVLRFDGRSWLAQSPLPEATAYAAAVVAGEDIFLLGGLRKLGDIASASRHFRHWRKGTGCEDLASFPGRSRVTAAVVGHRGRIYVFGGVHQEEGKAIETSPMCGSTTSRGRTGANWRNCLSHGVLGAESRMGRPCCSW